MSSKFRRLAFSRNPAGLRPFNIIKSGPSGLRDFLAGFTQTILFLRKNDAKTLTKNPAKIPQRLQKKSFFS